MTTNEILRSSTDSEATSTPFWAIVEPAKGGGLILLAGIWFNRPAAEDYLQATRYNFSKKAYVYCFSGHHSWHLKEMYANAKTEVPS